MSSDYSEDALVEQPAIELFGKLSWKTANVYHETFGPSGTLGRETDQEVVPPAAGGDGEVEPGCATCSFLTRHRRADARPLRHERREHSGEHLRQLLTEDHRYVFTLIQKFHAEKGKRHPQLSDRSDIIVITDEAHRSQYETPCGSCSCAPCG